MLGKLDKTRKDFFLHNFTFSLRFITDRTVLIERLMRSSFIVKSDEFRYNSCQLFFRKNKKEIKGFSSEGAYESFGNGIHVGSLPIRQHVFLFVR